MDGDGRRLRMRRIESNLRSDGGERSPRGAGSLLAASPGGESCLS
jgi:hypothetical protein